MPCFLSPSVSGGEDFTAPTGSLVTLRLQAPPVCGAEIVHIRYAQEPIDAAPPLQFTVLSGRRILTVLVEASAPGAELQLIEDGSGSPPHVIDRFHYDPKNPARGYMVRGV